MPLTLLKAPILERSDFKGGAPAPLTETKIDRLLKLIPSEVLMAYPAALALATQIAWPSYDTMLAVLGLVLVAATLYRDGKIHQLPQDWKQYVVRGLAFASWALLIGEPLKPFGVDLETARTTGSVGAVFIPMLGYFVLPAPES